MCPLWLGFDFVFLRAFALRFRLYSSHGLFGLGKDAAAGARPSSASPAETGEGAGTRIGK
jgi:hypothetical protein